MYRKGTSDLALATHALAIESPSVELMEKLQKKGAVISYSDPHVPVFPRMREHHFDLRSVELTAEVVAGYDCVLVGRLG